MNKIKQSDCIIIVISIIYITFTLIYIINNQYMNVTISFIDQMYETDKIIIVNNEETLKRVFIAKELENFRNFLIPKSLIDFKGNEEEFIETKNADELIVSFYNSEKMIVQYKIIPVDGDRLPKILENYVVLIDEQPSLIKFRNHYWSLSENINIFNTSKIIKIKGKNKE
jgi:hypothetical protein